MSAVVLGLVAAVAWGVHDFFARIVGRAVDGLQSTLAVLVCGAVALGVAFLAFGGPLAETAAYKGPIVLAGLAYAAAFYWLFLAYAHGPVALVTPIITAYPVYTLAWSGLQGTPASAAETAAAILIVVGVALVAAFAMEPSHDEGAIKPQSRVKAILFSIVAGLGFSVSFIVGQTAAQEIDPISIAFLSRLCSVVAVAPVLIRSSIPWGPIWSWLPLIALMGALDAVALAAIVAAGKLPDATMTQVVASSLGVVTVGLAIIFLKERLCWQQVLGMALVFGGVSLLSQLTG